MALAIGMTTHKRGGRHDDAECKMPNLALFHFHTLSLIGVIIVSRFGPFQSIEAVAGGCHVGVDVATAVVGLVNH
jgi:hypothetical protein